LQEALAKFEEGMQLKKLCEQKLAETEARIDQYVESESQEQSS